MIIDLKGRRAVVIGSTAGIGRATAEGLARAGAAVVINGRGEERVAATLREMRKLLPDADITGYAPNSRPAGDDEARLGACGFHQQRVRARYPKEMIDYGMTNTSS